jgi:peptide/nickel transport system permease protein
MGRYITVRVVQAAIVLFCLVTFVFLASRVLGDPASLMAPLEASPQQIQDLRDQLGFSDPIGEQYVRFLGDVIHGDLGTSTWQQVPALDLVLSRLPATWALAFSAIFIATIIGIPLGIVASRRPRSLADNIVTGLSIISASIPNFWLALMLIAIFAVHLGWLPTSGYGSWQNFVLPLATLVPLSAGRISQITRTAMVDVLNQAYIRTARAKGLRERSILYAHALRNAALPVLIVGAAELADLLAGSVIVETIFAWPGVGYLTTQAIVNRDLPVVTAAVLVIGVQVLLLNIIVDIYSAAVDPQIRLR